MPFTLSHPAAVILFSRTGLPVAAMVAGSMAPDVPLFVPVPGGYASTHSAVGVPTTDLLLGVLGLLVWVWLVRDALVDVAPAAVRERLAVTVTCSRREWVLVPVGVVLGASTHVVWDLFTHRGRWGAAHVEWLRETHGALLGSSWAQYASGAIGLALVAAWAASRLRTSPRRPRRPRVPELGVRALVGALLVAFAVAVVAGLSAASGGPRAMAARGAIRGTDALVLALLGLAVLWQVRARRSAPAP